MKVGRLILIGAITAILWAASANVSAARTANRDWVQLHSGVTEGLNDITCSSPKICVAVGDSGTIVVTGDGGRSWHGLHNPFTGTGHSLTSVRCNSILFTKASPRGDLPLTLHCDIVAPPNVVLWRNDLAHVHL